MVASSQPKPGLDGWKEIADMLNQAATTLEKSGLKTGYHNHQPEFTKVEGVRPMEILAKNTKPSVMLQLDVGTCLETGSDPVEWIRANPGRIRSIHCKDWSPDKKYAVLFGGRFSRLESNLRRRGKCGRDRILSGGTRGQPLFRDRDGGEMPSGIPSDT